MKLLMSDYQVTLVDNKMSEFYVKFHGPAETPFAKGTWRLHVELPEQFPYKSPSLGFVNKIFHPNIDELSGSVCLDVINQTWSPMFELINIFEIFLPQLLRYPNPADPLNGEAAALLMRDPKAYAKKVEDYVSRYATADAADADEDEDEDEDMEEGLSNRRRDGSKVGGGKVVNGNGTGFGNGNGSSSGNGNGNGASHGNGNGKKEDEDEDEDEDDDEDDKMSDMGELSDGDEFMGEMDD